MAVIENQIETKLTSAFQPAFLDVENESHKHNVPPGSESHFRVTVVSEEFEGMSLVKRHQKINEVLRDELKGRFMPFLSGQKPLNSGKKMRT